MGYHDNIHLNLQLHSRKGLLGCRRETDSTLSYKRQVISALASPQGLSYMCLMLINFCRLWLGSASVNIATDLAVAFLPVRVIWNLQIANRQKIALIGVLTIGWFVCVVSVLRLTSLITFLQHPDDSSYYGAPAAYWSGIEMNLAIVCASLPTLKPLITKIIPGFSSRLSGRRTATGGSSRLATFGARGRNTARQTADIELGLGAPESTHSEMPKSPDDGAFDKNIYISRQYEQHFEHGSRPSDGESQRELVQELGPV